MNSLPSSMQAMEIAGRGKAARLRLASRSVPMPRDGQVLVRASAAGVNRGDLYQVGGGYAPPAGASDIPGLEIAGTIVALGPNCQRWRIGERVCALLAGGGYAEYATVPEGQCLPLPDTLSMVEAAAWPEALFTCWTTLVDQGKLRTGETVLIHGGASGIGMVAIQLSCLLGARVLTTAGSQRKCEACLYAGADVAIDYRRADFVAEVRRATDGQGVDVVLDMVAGDYIARSMEVMAAKGRHVSIGVMSGRSEATIPVNLMLRNRLVLTASTLRGRDIAEKQAIRDAVEEKVWPRVADGSMRARIHAIFPLDRAPEAHEVMARGEHIGKIVLSIGDGKGEEAT